MSSKNSKKVAIITGSTKGIGRSIAEELAKNDVITVITSRNKLDAEQAAEEINALGGQAVGFEFNIATSTDLPQLIHDTIDTYGRLDTLVNNALSQKCCAPVDSLSDQQIAATFNSNITHTFLLSKMAYPHLKKTRGNIINISSIVVSRHLLGLPLYAIIKGAISQMTKVLAAEWAIDGIRVNALAPGFIRTNAFSDIGMPEEVIDKSYEYYKNYIPLKQIGKPSDVGKLAAFLASDAARLLTGDIIDIDGGLAIQGLQLYQQN